MFRLLIWSDQHSEPKDNWFTIADNKDGLYIFMLGAIIFA